MLAAAVRAAGAIAYRVGAVDDNPRSFRKVLSEQLVRADLVVTSGGVSMGEKDVVKETLSALGTVSFDKVAMQPGKPQGFGRVFDEQKPIITLPGNPVSAYVSFEVFVLPAIRRLMGRTPYRRPMVHAVLASDLQSQLGLRQYVRGIFEVTHRGAKVTPVQGHGSHLHGRAGEVQRADRRGRGRDGAQPRRHRAHPRARQAVLMGSELSHVDESGAARMVDVSGKDVTARSATARGGSRSRRGSSSCCAARACRRATRSPSARIAGIMAAKRTPDLVPLCHPLAISGVEVEPRRRR